MSSTDYVEVMKPYWDQLEKFVFEITKDSNFKVM